ncbi:hypothetical protein RCJ22_25275 [Vibrio sp. FNV 38]|nr:hypothetical protein [Vibrio sp. FNV 38]
MMLFFVTTSFATYAEVESDSYSANYTITEQFGFQVTSSDMHFSVSEGHVIREIPKQNIIEHWVRRENGRHVFYRHFPAHQSSIYYNRGDLRALSLANDWDTVTQMIPHRWLDLLERVTERETQWGLVADYEGMIGDYQISVSWLEDKNLPAKYTIRQQHQRLTLELVELKDAKQVLNKLADWDSYRTVDFSDAMDMERDGFVQYLIATGQLETSNAGLHMH